MRVVLGRHSRDCQGFLPAAQLIAAAALLLAGCQGESTTPSGAGDDANVPPTEFTLTPAGAAAAKAATIVGMHKLGTLSTRSLVGPNFSADEGKKTNSPFDLTFFGGPVVKSATSFNVYVNCATTPAACWGTGALTPGTFLKDMNRGNFIRLANEYIGSDAKGHFPVQEMKTTATFSDFPDFPNPNVASIDDILHIIFDAVGSTNASGYTAIYHVFLPQGTDMCIDITVGLCYSPDVPENFVFCAFHGSVDFSSTLHVLFSVEPYQAVDGCQIPGQTPHGVIDATASTLSHELIETITDPDGNAWFNSLFLLEVADICSAFATNQRLNGHNYFLQSEYSNKLQACTNRAP